jgi:DNA-directed RNA polymerase
MINEQIELEKKMTQCSIDKYRIELEKSKQNGTFSNTSIANKLLSVILDQFTNVIQIYIEEYSKGKAVRSTMAADVIQRLNNIDIVAYITSKIILNSIYIKMSIQSVYKNIGQALEDEYKMKIFKKENLHYYKTIQEDLNKRGAKAKRKKNITTGVFNKRLGFHLDQWTMTEKFQTGMILTKLFVESTGLVEFEEKFEKKRHYKSLVPSQELVSWIESTNEKFEVMQPFFLPMVCPPKDWTGILDGGYISPYLKKNKLVKNNNKDYLRKISTATMPKVYEALNHIQSTAWQINEKILEVVEGLWEIGKAVAELPDREDEPLIPYPYPEKDTKNDDYTEDEIKIIKKWKQDTYEIHKRNVQKRSVRILVAQILRIAKQFSKYEKIWFPYQMDFRGRIYPIPVLLQPQGSDLAKGLLRFAEGKKVDKHSIKWLQIHGANTYGYDKESYQKRIEWVLARHKILKAYVANPLENQGWAEADKPFQFLAWCFEYVAYLNNPDTFKSHIPVQLDGTCNGLQHYSALLRDSVGGAVVNLIDTDKPSDIYAKVAERLKKKLNEHIQSDMDDTQINIRSSNSGNNLNRNVCASRRLGNAWLHLGINRKLTKRPVMVLPYGGTILSCREYIGEYLKDNYSPIFIWEHFKVGENPTDCIFKVSSWLSKYLWEAIQDTLKAAIVGMSYLRKIARIITKEKQYIEWLTPAGLLVRQVYTERKKKMIRTELYGNILKTTVNLNIDTLDTQRQVNGICPNFIHSLDAACLMLYLNKCKQEGINSIISIHDCYGTHACDTDKSARFLREAFVEIYRQPILENFTEDVTALLKEDTQLPEIPEKGSLDVEKVLNSDYFFN